MPGRSPAMTAMTAATIDELSGGRMLVGIGSSGPQVSEGWHGQRFGAATAAYARLRRGGEAGAFPRAGRIRRRDAAAAAARRPGRALKLTIAPVQDRIPIYLAAIGPRNTTLAGEIADGWLPTFFSPEHVGEFRELLQEGADRAGRTLDGFDIAPTVQVFISDDHAAARDLMRPILALYIGGMGSRNRTSTRAWSNATGSRTPPPRSRTSTSTASATRRAPRSPTS